MIIATVPVISMIVGVLLWALPVPPKVSEIGKWCFIIGLFWLIGAASHSTVKF